MNRFWESENSRLTRIAESRIAFVIARLMFGFFVFCTAFYCLLYYVPFSRNVLFDWDVVPALSLFATYHSLAFWVVTLPTMLTVLPYLREPRSRRPVLALIVVLGLAGVALTFHPLLTNLPPDERSLSATFATLFPLCWIAAVDWKSRSNWQRVSSRITARVSFKNIVATAALVSAVYLGIFMLRYVSSGAATVNPRQLFFFALCSFALHIVLFGLMFSVFRICDAISRSISDSFQLAFLVQIGLLTLALSVIIRKVVFTSVTFNGLVADLTAGAIAFSFVVYLATSLLRLNSLGAVEKPSPANSFFAKVGSLRHRRWLVAAISTAAIFVFAYAALVNLEGLDWQGLLQRISVLMVWTATFALFRSFRRQLPAKQYSLALLIPILLAGTVLYFIVQHDRSRIARTLRQRAGPASLLLEQYVDYDPSFKVAAEMLAPSGVDVFEGSSGDRFFAVLRENTNLPPTVTVAPKDFKLVDEIKPATDKPNIFIFVIDSLRQDYLSPYNPRVNFTPAINDFAHDSVVMKNAFTRYDGTALSEPAIWAGGMQVHKQFAQPFYSINSLQKLVDAEHYRSFITIDPHLKPILQPSHDMVELDRGGDWKQYDLAATLSELETHLQTGQEPQPYFVYSQPQNLHQVSLKLHPRARPGNYPGFEARRAAELERIDKAFGDFLSFLKSRGMYDESIIILTADHGDSLGEGGHWGHGNAIYPELIRIPMIIHLPENLKRDLVYDPNSLAFSTDITPSLYYLLGQRPIRNSPMFGRPLFTLTMEEQTAYVRDSYLIGDSYGPVYGILRDNGRTLFVADAVANQAFIYDLTHRYAGERLNIDDEVAIEYQQTIVSEIEKIRIFYDYQAPSQVSPDTNQPSKIAQLYSLLFSNN
jgi:Sulfatase